ncbi:ATP-binding protein of ABC transporter [Richelia intracellularis HH01]|uniref:ATP-binding protein of ABC transporter n=1 Tax=Richelia intracellularis HH01 TaxID=1165094 RepID=M1WSJ4_9NOST|nr:ABC transporter ATP-binding protein [Richelia intracellularis]CCH67494.1 ATP-binding protein of ABC transporter [Richelia intracellularis HH01]
MATTRRLAKLVAYLRPHWKEATLGIIALLAVNGLGVYIPLLIRSVVNKLSEDLTYQQLLHYVLLIISLTSAMWLIRMASRIWIFGVGRKVEFELKQKIFEHLLKLEPAYFTTCSVGNLISRATSDVDNIRRLLGFAVLTLANTFFAYALTLPVMLSINVNLTLASLLIYPFMFLLVYSFGNRLRDQQLKLQESIADMSQLIQEDVSGISLIKIYAQEKNEQREFAKKNHNLLKANLKLTQSNTTLFPLIGGLASISSLIIIWLGGNRISSGSLAVGDFVTLLIYLERLIFPTALLGFTVTAYQRGEVSIDRIESILNVQPKICNSSQLIGLPPSSVKGKITAKNLSYTYPDSLSPALDNINFTINPGELVAIVGPIGSGKSTLASSLPRLIDINPEQLFLDGVDITQISLSDLRGAIAYVPQDSFLFSTTIKNNICYGDPTREETEIEEAAQQSQIHSEIINFPQQYQTIVGEKGIALSGGQRQRTSLARAMLIDAPVLILDDSLSSIDNQNATSIIRNILAKKRLRTVIFITHQLPVAAACDRIFVIDKGKIVQMGTQMELLQQPGLYKTLWGQNQIEELLH